MGKNEQPISISEQQSSFSFPVRAPWAPDFTSLASHVTPPKKLRNFRQTERQLFPRGGIRDWIYVNRKGHALHFSRK
ncbi:hypothetical protein CEXT_367861 [Caerostris extrusa]|uniref:Uncharacterized protein n=1 Tax=Caerostris extrusa TaxID=172846 RepID=A0AAV4NB15_CAEEX|nr:hypothetical protein CEXT_367861 [Caerostris extrusa]